MKIDNGFHPGLSWEQYRGLDALNCSTLKAYKSCPANAKAYMDKGTTETKAMALGSAFHCLALEPERFDLDYVLRPEGIDRRTKVGKATWLEFVEANAHRTIVDDPDAHRTTKAMLDSLQGNPHTAEILNRPNTHKECAVVGELVIDRQLRRFKALFDLVDAESGDLWIDDIKTCQDASPRGFSRQSGKLEYYMQAALYMDLADALDTEVAGFRFLAVESKPNHLSNVYTYPFGCQEHIEGRRLYKERARTHFQCVEAGKWPGYTPMEAMLPDYCYTDGDF